MTANRQSIETIVDRITASHTPAVVLGIGVPASGKSTLMNAVAGELGVRTVDVDGILRRTKSEGWDSGSYGKFQDRVRAEGANKMRLGGVALIDGTHCHEEDRRADMVFYRLIGARTVGAVLMEVDLDRAVQRDAQRTAAERQGANAIAFMHASLQAGLAKIEDGFDWIERVSA